MVSICPGIKGFLGLSRFCRATSLQLTPNFAAISPKESPFLTEYLSFFPIIICRISDTGFISAEGAVAGAKDGSGL
jgi:hypothetical protein